MTKSFVLKSFIILFIAVFSSQHSNAQCNWSTQFYDGFEYSTPCPDILPGTVYQTIPQTFAVRTGAKSLYANFVNCAGGTGTCAGDQYYERVIPVCAGLPIRFSAWFCTSFNGGPHCNIRIVITDSAGVVLASMDSLAAPVAPTWIQYSSGSITPTNSSVIVKFYTNVDGGNGNDLSMDDLLLEQCLTANTHSFTVGYVCNNLPVVNLFNSIPGVPVTTGSWAGPSTLTGGYLGSFTPSVNTGGNYVYSSMPYGSLPGCPIAKDTVLAIKVTAPVSQLAADTTVCTNQTVLLNPATNISFNYLWSNGATSPTITASTASSVDITVDYSVTITDIYGCVAQDTCAVTFEVCNALGEIAGSNGSGIYPNPTSDILNLRFSSSINSEFNFVLLDLNGKVVFNQQMNRENQQLTLPTLSDGLYLFRLIDANGVKEQGKLMIEN